MEIIHFLCARLNRTISTDIVPVAIQIPENNQHFRLWRRPKYWTVMLDVCTHINRCPIYFGNVCSLNCHNCVPHPKELLFNICIRSLLRLTLLWFYTFGTQLFLNEDGYTTDKIESVSSLLNAYGQQYSQSAIFLFFRGRLERMKVWSVFSI